MFDALFSLEGSSSIWLKTIFDASAKGTLVLIVAGGLALLLRRQSATIRHGMWCLLFLGLLSIPVFSLILPEWRLALLRPAVETSQHDPASQTTTAKRGESLSSLGAIQRERLGVPMSSVDRARAGEPHRREMHEAGGGGSTFEVAKVRRTEKSVSSIDISDVILTIWGIGVILSLIPLARDVFANSRVVATARRINNPHWSDMVKDVSADLRLNKNVELFEGKSLQMPIAWGIVRARILLPLCAHQWPRERQRIVLFHELGHVKRSDVPWQMMARCVCSLYWFHPLVWIALCQMRIDREHACDDWVLNAGEKPVVYASHLVELARTLRPTNVSASSAIGMAHRSNLETRLLSILDAHRKRESFSPRTIIITLLGLACIVIPLATMNIGIRADETVAIPPVVDNRNNVARESAHIPGLLAEPAELPGIGRWQLMSATPRGFVRTVAWSPDGRRVSFGDSGMVRICSAEDMQTVQVLVGHRGPVLSIDWSPDGSRIASSGRDGTVRIWSDAGVPLAVLTNHAASVRGVAWSPDGRRLASASDDGHVRLWKSDGTPLLTYKDHAAPVRCVAWSPDGKQLVSGDNAHSVRIWHADGTSGPVLEGHLGPVTAVSWNSDGKRIASASLGNFYTRFPNVQPAAHVRIWDVDGTLKQELSGHRSPIIAVAWSPDGEQLASSGDGSGVYLWSDNDVPTRLTGASYVWARATSLAWSPDSNRLIVGSLNTAQNLSIDGAGGPLMQAKHRSSLPVVAWNRDGNRFATAGFGTNLGVWNAQGVPLPKFKHNTMSASAFAWSPSDDHIASSSRGGIDLWNANGERESVIDLGNRSIAEKVDWSPDGRQLVGAIGRDVVLVALDEKHDQIRMPGHIGRVTKVKWSPDGKWIVSASTDGTVRLWTAQGDEGPIMEGNSSDVDSVAWMADSTRFVVGYNTGIWQFWNIDGTPGMLRRGHFESIMGLAASPDGKQIASAGWDYTLRLWDNDGNQLDTIEAHSAPVCYVTWSPDSKQFATASWDRTLRLWSAETRKSDTVIFFLDNDQTATFNASGELLDGDPAAVEESFLYLVEKPDKAIEILKHSEFKARIRL